MRLAVGIAGIVVVAAASSLLFVPQGLLHAASGEEVIDARVNFMQEDMGSNWKVLAAFAKGGKGSLADVEKSALAISNLSKKISGHFPKDTGRGAYPDHLTRALPAIWNEPQKFQGFIQKLEEESTKLAALAKSGDTAAVVAMIGETGSYNRTKIGCADCHQAYQGPRVKK